jgi:hypothetical protein
MKSLRLIGALCAALMLSVAPAKAAEQASYVTPIAGPMDMTKFTNVYLNPALRALASCSWGTTAPANGPSAAALPYQCWADTTSNPVLFKLYDGASWAIYGALNTTTHVWTPYRNGTAIVAVATSGSAADLTAGTLPAARLPNPSGSTLGGTQSKTCSASQWLNDLSTGGVLACAQPNFTDLAGTASLAQLPAFSGMTAAAAAADADTFPTNQGAGNLKQTLAAIKTWIKAWIAKADVGLGNVDNTSDAIKNSATVTLLNKTFVCANQTSCVVRIGTDVSGLGTGVAAAMGVNIGATGAPVVLGGALGTPSSGVATNLTGTAAGLTAGNVTTNANLTGEVTSVGNATTMSNASVISKLLTSFSAGAGTVSSSDSIFTAIQKIVGNVALKADASRSITTGCGLTGGGDLSADRTLRVSFTVNSQTSTSYSVLDGDCGKVVRLTNASSVAVSLPQPNGSTFVNGWTVDFQNTGAGAVTITSTASTINGNANLVLTTNQGAHCDSDGSNFTCVLGVGSGGGGGLTSMVCAGVTITSTGTCPPQFGFSNCSITAAVSGNNLTVALKDNAGADPSSSSPCNAWFRSATAAPGAGSAVWVQRTVTAATSLTANAGSTFGVANSLASCLAAASCPFRIWVTLIDTGSTAVLGVTVVTNQAGIRPLNQSAPVTTVACSACTNATAIGTMYSTATQTAKSFLVLGHLDWGSGLGTAGTYASGPTLIQTMGPGVRLPSESVQQAFASTTSQTNNSTATPATAISVSIGPTAAMNLIKIKAYGG